MFLNRLSEYLSHRRGMPVMVGIGLIVLNFAIQFIPGLTPVAQSNALLHLGIVVGFIGLLLSQALG